MRKAFRYGVIGLTFALSLTAAPVASIDTFSDGTTMGWDVGSSGPSGSHPAPPEVILTGGPAGIDDAYLQLTAVGGGGPGSRLVVLAGPQWRGDFSGVAGIRMDVNNFGPSDLFLRLLFESFPAPGRPPAHLAVSADAVFVPAGGGWQSVFFPLGPNALLALIGNVEDAITDTDRMRLFHNEEPRFDGPAGTHPLAVQAVVGVDNIQAVPEPASAALFACGAAGLILFHRHRRTRA